MRKAIALVLVVLLVFPLLFATLMSFSISTWALDRGFYLALASDERIYEALLTESIWDEALLHSELSAVPELDNIPGEVLALALREVVTPLYLRSQVVNLVNRSFDAIEGRQPLLEISVDLTPLKDRLRGEAGERFARILAANLPQCREGFTPVAPGANLPRCRPAAASEESVVRLVLANLPKFLDRLPDSYPVPADTVRLHYQPQDEFWIGFVGSQRLLWASIVLALIAAGFWLGAAFLAGENRRQVVRWLGWPLFLPAVLTLIAGLLIRIAAGWPWVDQGLASWISSDAWYNAQVMGVFTTVARAAVKAIARGFLIAGGVAIGISAGLIVWSYSIQVEEE